MLGRPVLLAVAAAIGSLLSVTGASAGCYSCGCSAPVVYVSPCAPRAYYALPPMYVVNQGPAYTLPVPLAAEPTPVYPYAGYRHRSYGATAYAGEEADETTVYPGAYRGYHRYGYAPYGLRMYRHHGRPHIGMRHLHGDRRFAHMPRMHMQHRMQMRMNMQPRLAPGFVHPQGKKHY